MSEVEHPSLRKAICTASVPNTMLFSGSDASLLRKNALITAASLLGSPLPRLEGNNHPDFHAVVPEGKSALHSIESIRAAIEASHIAPFEAKAKFFLLESAERMQPAAANALLKTLEEPVLNSYWVLLSTKPKELLPTILSRCVQYTFNSASQEASKGEESRLLRSLLTERPRYPKLAASLEKIEKALEGEEAQTKILNLFVEIADYFRDEERSAIATGQEPLWAWEEPLQEAVLGFERNIKLSACLEVFFFRVFKIND